MDAKHISQTRASNPFETSYESKQKAWTQSVCAMVTKDSDLSYNPRMQYYNILQLWN